MEKLLPGIPQVAVFDTSFHQTLPKEAYIYGLPYKYYEDYRIRRYGFHGTSHKFVAEKACKILGWNIEEKKIITYSLTLFLILCTVVITVFTRWCGKHSNRVKTNFSSGISMPMEKPVFRAMLR